MGTAVPARPQVTLQTNAPTTLHNTMTGVRINCCYAALIALALASASATAQVPQTDVYFAKEIWTGQGAPIPNAAMVVIDGRIAQIGPRAQVSIPATAVPHELGEQVIIPGLIAAQSNLAGSQSEPRTVTPGIRALDGFDFFADRQALLRAGITTVQVSPTSSRLMPGVGGVVQLAGDDLAERILAEQESLRIVLSNSSRNPPRIYEPPVGPVSEDRPLVPTRPQLASLSASIAGLRQIFQNATADETFVSSNQDEVVEAVRALLKAKVPVRITAQTAPEILGAIGLAKEFDFKLILDDCRGLEPFKNNFASWKPHVAGVILSGVTPGAISNPTFEQIESQQFPWEYARELLDAGIPIAIRANRDSTLPHLMFAAGQFMQDKLTASELLSSLTSTPAMLMNVEQQVGSLSTGLRADFVVLDGRPFQLSTRIRATFLAGQPQFERQPNATTKIIHADRIYLGDGHYLDEASVVVKGKTVRGLGSSVSAPADAQIKSFAGAVIVPGFVDLGALFGLGGSIRGNLPLQTKLGDQLYPDDPAIAYARRHGITTALIGAARRVGQASPVVAIKLGDDARVIADPVAIRFQLTGDTAAGVASNERLLKAGKAYADSWNKYEKDLAEYEAKVKAQAAAAAKKPASAKDAENKKKVESKSTTGEQKKPAETKKPAADDKEKPEKKDDKEKEKEKVLPDPITGTWEGTIDVERLPPQFRKVTFELVLEGSEVTGSIAMMRQNPEISSGSFDRQTRELSLTITLRGNSITMVGNVDEDSNFEGSMDLGRMGKVNVTASRTVDKSKKPEPPQEQDKPEKKEKPDSEKEKPTEDKPSQEPDKKDADKKQEAQKADAKSGKQAEKKAELKPPKKPRKSDALEPYRALFAGEIPAFVESRDLNSIKATAELFSKKYGIRTIIAGADDLARDPTLLHEYDVSVCTGPQLSVTIAKQPPTNMPQLLANERLPFGFQSNAITGSAQLPAAVQFSVSQGLSTSDALRALTSAPANMLSEQMKFGQLATGKDADLVVLSGPPFEFSTTVLAVMIDGVWVYEREEQK